jgi:preprotein translocase subunit SecG
MYLFVSIIYCLVCAFLIFVVLLQQGRGGGMGSAFGGSSQTVFGGAGAGNILTRITAICAALFMILSAVLAYMSSSSDSTLEDVTREIEARQTPAEVRGEGEPAAAEPAAAEPAAAEPAAAEDTEAVDPAAAEDAEGVEPAAEEPAAE